MAGLSIFPCFAKSKLFSLLVCFALAAFICVLLSAGAFAGSDRWTGCRGATLTRGSPAARRSSSVDVEKLRTLRTITKSSSADRASDRLRCWGFLFSANRGKSVA